MSFNPEGRILVFFSRHLSADEMQEAYDGPELVNVTPPKLHGLPKVGSTLTCLPGIWSLPDHLAGMENGAPKFEYRWYRSTSNRGACWKALTDKEGATYSVVDDDRGCYLKCVVRGLNDGGFDRAADTDSNTVGPIEG